MENGQGAPQPNVPTKVCKKCHATVPKYADRCPQCGANLKPVYKKAWFWIVIVILVIIIGAAGCTAAASKAVVDSVNENTNFTTSSSSSSSSSSAAEKYTISGEEMADTGYGSYKITGTLTNTSGKEFSYIQIEYVLKDASGAQVGTAYANTSNLAAGGTWKFEAVGYVGTDTEVATFERADVTGM